MATINTNNTKSIIEIHNELADNGVEMEIVYVNNQKFCVLGYANEKDKQASLKAIETAVNSSNGNLYEAMVKLTTIANLHEVSPDEEVEVDGKTLYLSYGDRALYDANGDEVCNCNDLNCPLPDEAIKALLLERVKH